MEMDWMRWSMDAKATGSRPVARVVNRLDVSLLLHRGDEHPRPLGEKKVGLR